MPPDPQPRTAPGLAQVPAATAPSIDDKRSLSGSLFRDVAFPTVLFALSFVVFMIARSVALYGAPTDAAFRWDATWYRQIIEQGYMTDGNRNVWHNVVFFPLYPLTCQWLKSLLRLNTATAMQLVSCITTWLSFLFLYKVLLRNVAARTARASLALLALSPFAVFFYNGYTEPLFLLTIALFFYFLLNRDLPWAAAISAGLAGAARPYGCLLALVLAFELLRRHYRKYGFRLRFESAFMRQILLLIPLCFTGLATYTLWLGYRFGDPLAFSHNMIAWNVIPGGHLDLRNLLTFRHVVAGIPYALTTQFWDGPFSIGLAMFIVLPFLLWICRGKMHPAFAFFAILMFCFFDFVGHHGPTQMMDIGRHLMAVFPLTVLIALVLDPGAVDRYARAVVMPGSAAAPTMTWHFLCSLPLLMLIVTFAWLFWRFTLLFFEGVFV